MGRFRRLLFAGHLAVHGIEDGCRVALAQGVATTRCSVTEAIE
jgi:hypothetical protein